MSDSSSDGTGSIAEIAIIVAVTVLCVALRFYFRIVEKISISWDDWMILIGLLLALLAIGLLVYADVVDPDGSQAVDDGLDFRPHETYLKFSWITTILYFSMVTAIKPSILLMYRRIFSIDDSFRRQSFLLGAVVVAFWTASTIVSIMACIPVQYSWTSMGDPRYCYNYNIFWMVSGAVEVLIDTAILALPVRMVLRLQLSLKRKISIMLIFLLGGFVVITGIIRTIYGYTPGRLTPTYTKAEFWSEVHIGVAIICACLPSLRPLVLRLSSCASGISSFFPAISKSLPSTTPRRRYHELRGRHIRGESAGWSPEPTTSDTVDDTLLTSQERGIALKNLHDRTARSGIEV